MRQELTSEELDRDYGQRALGSILLITDSPAEIVGRVFDARIRELAVDKVHLAKFCWQNWGRDARGVIEWNVFAGRALGASSDNICPLCKVQVAK